MLDTLTDLDSYIQTYGRSLQQNASASMEPLHTPGKDEPIEVKLLRDPFPAQQHVFTATTKALRRQKGLFLVGECGVGKTLIAMGAVHAYDSAVNGLCYRAIVMCPGQLTKKWVREIKETIPNAKARIIKGWKDAHSLTEITGGPTCPEWYIISKDRAKLGPSWRPAAIPWWRRKSMCLCPSCNEPIVDKDGDPITLRKLGNRRSQCKNCGEQLWQWTHKPDRWSPADFIKKKLPRFFDYFVLDECHQAKSAAVAQSNAAGALVSCTKKVIAMTGTIIGGKAEDIRSLMFRICPSSIVEEGFEWNQVTAFNELYGRIETRISERDSGSDNRQSRGSTRSVTKSVKPGVMPALFGRHLIANTVFLRLDEVSDYLPDLSEHVIGVELDGCIASAYRDMENDLRVTLKEMLRRNDRRLMGTMVNALLCYPDHPYEWDTLGYWDKDKETGEKEMFHPVHEPKNMVMDYSRAWHKEEKLLEIVLDQKSRGRQTWVYVQYTDKHDVVDRIKLILRKNGIRAGVLRASVEPSKREEWIAKHGPEYDVIISHPQLVETGLDLFDKGGAYNFPALVFYETGYILNTLRQAARRAWRLAQAHDCDVYYLYYRDTMQASAMELMGRKLLAAEALDGRFSSEGLNAMAGEDESAEMALARSLANKLDDRDCDRTWDKIAQKPRSERKQGDGGESDSPPPPPVVDSPPEEKRPMSSIERMLAALRSL